MQEHELEHTEKGISRFFDDESVSFAKKHDEKGVPWSAQAQIDDIVLSGAKTAIDVGSGPGSVMKGMIEGGLDHVAGVDLSDDMNKLALERLEYANIDASKYSITNESFLSLEHQKVDAISLHRVLCCHPDREGMLDKSISYNPKIISLTVPRPWLLMKLVIKIYAFFAKRKGNFHPYGHSQKGIDNQLLNNKYEIIARKKGFAWVQTTYKLVED
ncbi:MAG: hypothetical protein HeimC2_00770 [Candidatus Heimdallarchaeota archaeon LC_2]|nr:MAG: hypothetical protein HeimC2_00770 [Candidatus Heimdallarchaeota archaeon LC_2]